MRQYSVSEARIQFSKILREAEAGTRVQITRRGRPVAYLVGVDHLPALDKPRKGFMERLAEFKEKHAPDGIDFDPDELFGDRRS